MFARHEPTFWIAGRLEWMQLSEDGHLALAITPAKSDAALPCVTCICHDRLAKQELGWLFTIGRQVVVRGVLEPRRRIIGNVEIVDLVLVVRTGAPLREDWADQ